MNILYGYIQFFAEFELLLAKDLELALQNDVEVRRHLALLVDVVVEGALLFRGVLNQVQRLLIRDMFEQRRLLDEVLLVHRVLRLRLLHDSEVIGFGQHCEASSLGREHVLAPRFLGRLLALEGCLAEAVAAVEDSLDDPPFEHLESVYLLQVCDLLLRQVKLLQDVQVLYLVLELIVRLRPQQTLQFLCLVRLPILHEDVSVTRGGFDIVLPIRVGADQVHEVHGVCNIILFLGVFCSSCIASLPPVFLCILPSLLFLQFLQHSADLDVELPDFPL